MRECRQAEAIYLATIDEALTSAQRSHARTCAECAQAMARGAAFVRELEISASEVAGPHLPPTLTDLPPNRPARRAVGLVVATVAGVLVFGAGLALGRAGLPASSTVATAPTPAEATLFVLVSNHNRTPVTIVIETTRADRTTRITSLVPACRGGYLTAPLGDRWLVRSGDLTAALGPPAPVAGGGDVTVRIAHGAGGADVFMGTPQENDLDVAQITAADVAPCR